MFWGTSGATVTENQEDARASFDIGGLSNPQHDPITAEVDRKAEELIVEFREHA
ncbi:hypothetical protein ACERK3_15635 [Phycisphaerales bacterium AB-hyl4]|uniref:Uncharacterized protein n=1 Tax=Natronomicrosphaera hydrolytica TaxID=3242702 RepID=A0ABV4U9N4_9BACT